MMEFPAHWTTVPSLSLQEAWSVFENIGWTGGRNIEARVHGNNPIHHFLGSIGWNGQNDEEPLGPSSDEVLFLSACQTLLEAGLPLEKYGHEESTMFLESAATPIYFMALLLKKGANLFAEDEEGNQWPYYFAKNLGMFMPHICAKFTWLRESGLDLTHENHAGKSLLDLIENNEVSFLNASHIAHHKEALVNLLKEAHISKEREALSEMLPKVSQNKGLKHL